MCAGRGEEGRNEERQSAGVKTRGVCVRVCVCVSISVRVACSTFGGLALSYEKSSPLVAVAQQLPLRILPPHLPKIPPVTMTTTRRSQRQQQTGVT